MRIFKAKTLARFTKRERITDASLCEAIKEAERGLVNADLGGATDRAARSGQKRRLPDADCLPVEAEGGFLCWVVVRLATGVLSGTPRLRPESAGSCTATVSARRIASARCG